METGRERDRLAGAVGTSGGQEGEIISDSQVCVGVQEFYGGVLGYQEGGGTYDPFQVIQYPQRLEQWDRF